MMYENKKQPLASKQVYNKRVINSSILSIKILIGCLAIGTIGFYFLGIDIALIDAFHNASMLLSGMGPVLQPNQMNNVTKIFSSTYAIFSGIAFISTIGILMAPVTHRFFHKLHIEE